MIRLHLPALAIAVSVAGKGHKSGSLSRSGALAAAAAGYAALANPLGLWGACLLGFYLAGSRATKVKAAVKVTYEQPEHAHAPSPSKPAKAGGNRNALQVACNALLGCICAVAWRVLYEGSWEAGERFCVVDKFDEGDARRWSRVLVLAAVAFWAGCCGDTFASELGILSYRPPFLLSTLSVAPRGTNGAISAWGTLVSLLGGLFVGALAVGTLAVQGQAKECGAGWGWTGELMALDSLLGLLFQPTYYSPSLKLVVHSPPGSPSVPKDTVVLPGTAVLGHWLSNNGVNLVSTAAVAVAGAAYASM
ncbi:hypothetical protein JCM10213v2_008871 [Rhodosporidiobolus nylandii]